MTCPNCKEYFDRDTIPFPYGQPVTCPHCKAEIETDWDYVSEDSLAWWPTGKVITKPTEEENEPVK